MRVRVDLAGQQCGDAGGAGRLQQNFAALENEANGIAQCVVVDEDDVVNKFLDVRKRTGACNRCGKSIGDGVDAVETNRRVLLERARHGGCANGFDTNDARGRAQRFDGGGNAGDETAAADRYNDDVDIGQILDDLETNRALTGHDKRILVRMHECEAALFAQLLHLLERLEHVAVQDDFSAVASAGIDFGLRRVRRHDNRAGNSFSSGAVGEGLRMIAGGDADHAARFFLRAQMMQAVEDTARLEGAGFLKAFGLEIHITAGAGGERARSEQGRVVDLAGDVLCGGADVGKTDHSRNVGRGRVCGRGWCGPCPSCEPMNEDRRTRPADRRKANERRKHEERRRGMGPVMGDRRTRFSIVYFVVAFLLLIGLNYMLSRANTQQVAYSDFKARVAAGQISHVVLSPDMVRASVVDSLVKKGQPEVLTSVRVPDDPALIPLLESKSVKYEGTTQGWLTQMMGWLLPVGIMLLFWFWMMRRINPAQGVMTIGKNRARIMGEEGTGITFAEVAGADEAKQELVEVVEFLKTPEKFARLGAKIPKGVLLVGPPGTGKTLLARAVAGEAGVTFFSISGSEFVEMFVGVGAARVRDLFEQAKSNAPCIIFIDELDALGKARGVGGVMGGHDEREQTLNQLLVEMDGFDPRKGVIIMAATNRPEILDSALLRPGRFDRQVVVDKPDLNGREAILRVHAKDVALAPDVDLKVIARRTPGFVGADLANVLNEAALLAARYNKNRVDMSDIEAAIDRIVAGLEKRNRIINVKEREIVAYHEAGHALVAERVETADPVHKISIIPRGVAALGYTQQLPTDDRYLLQKKELEDRLAVLLGGRAAEQIVFGEISSGASNDLERATDMARRMVTELGMSEAVGPVTFSRRRGSFLQPQDAFEPREYSESTAQLIDAEVRELVVAAYERALTLLQRDRQFLESIAQRLLEKEVMDREELRELLGLPLERSEKPEVGHVPDQAAD